MNERSPHSEHSAYHQNPPVLHDFKYHMVNGVPRLGDQEEEEEE